LGREQPDQAVAVMARLRRKINGADHHDHNRFEESRAYFQQTGEDASHRDVRSAEVVEQEFSVW
jgi:hypothetical protein